jgi:hypothetical protein
MLMHSKRQVRTGENRLDELQMVSNAREDGRSLNEEYLGAADTKHGREATNRGRNVPTKFGAIGCASP